MSQTKDADTCVEGTFWASYNPSCWKADKSALSFSVFAHKLGEHEDGRLVESRVPVSGVSDPGRPGRMQLGPASKGLYVPKATAHPAMWLFGREADVPAKPGTTSKRRHDNHVPQLSILGDRQSSLHERGESSHSQQRRDRNQGWRLRATGLPNDFRHQQ